LIAPERIIISNQETGKILLSSQPAMNVDWQLIKKPDWMDIEPISGQTHNQIVELNYFINRVGLTDGIHTGVIEIRSKRAFTATASVFLDLIAKPLAEFNKSEIFLSEEETEGSFQVQNSGFGLLNWKIIFDHNWMEVIPDQGIITGGNSTTIKVKVNHSIMPLGTHQSHIQLVSNSIEEDPKLDVFVEVPPIAILSVMQQEIHFDYFQESKSFFLCNYGNAPTTWSMQINNDYINSDQLTGLLNRGDSVKITLTIDRTHLTSQTHLGNMTISGTYSHEIDVALRIDHFIDNKWHVEGWVVGSEYDHIHDKLFLILKYPHELRKLDILTQEIETLALTNVPHLIRISPDGNYAIIGHAYKLSYVCLNNMQIINTHELNFLYTTLVLTNAWVYLLPNNNSGINRIQCLNLETGEMIPSVGPLIANVNGLVKHPLEDFLISGGRLTTSPHFHKFDISEGIANHLYSTEVLTGWDVGSGIWITEDGTHIITENRNIYNLTDNPLNDFLFTGIIPGNTRIRNILFSLSTSFMFVSDLKSNSNESNNFIKQFSRDNFDYIKDIPLPKFIFHVGDGCGIVAESEPDNIFMNNDQTQLYAIVKSKVPGLALYDWAIARIDIE
jgi:hypothetical protein